MNYIIDKVKKYIKDNELLNYNDRVILGVSGGADSICLLNILVELKQEYKLSLNVVHVNHGIRGDEAFRDEEFVKMECERLGIQFESVYFDVPAIAKKDNLSEEEAGRIVRYKVFSEMLEKYEANKIAVAHNANDSVETIIHNMCRGSGIKGICGVLPKRDNIIRPVLCLTRNEIEKYLEDKGLGYITDSTNLSIEYTRNKIRLEVIPYLEKNINTKSVEHILSMGNQLLEIQDYIESEIDRHYSECVKRNDKRIVIEANIIKSFPAIIKKSIIRKAINEIVGKLKDITEEHIKIAMDIMENGTGRSANLPYDIVCIKEYDNFILTQKQVKNINEEFCIIINEPGEYLCMDGSKIIVSVENNVKFQEKIYTKWFDYDKISDALKLRFRNSGDYLEIESGRHKKLKSYFIDEKVPREQRDSIPLLADGSHVMWIIGHRISEQYKITNDTKKVLKVQYVERNGKSYGE